MTRKTDKQVSFESFPEDGERLIGDDVTSDSRLFCQRPETQSPTVEAVYVTSVAGSCEDDDDRRQR